VGAGQLAAIEPGVERFDSEGIGDGPVPGDGDDAGEPLDAQDSYRFLLKVRVGSLAVKVNSRSLEIWPSGLRT
jgi:hypothetical protein